MLELGAKVDFPLDLFCPHSCPGPHASTLLTIVPHYLSEASGVTRAFLRVKLGVNRTGPQSIGTACWHSAVS